MAAWSDREEARFLRDVVLARHAAWATVPKPPGLDELMERSRLKYGDAVVKAAASLGHGGAGRDAVLLP